jgi:hypothetical protein
MAKTDRFKRLTEISFDRYSIEVEVDWRYPAFFDWLQLSPSYRLAHWIAQQKVKRAEVPLPEDFAVVERTYAAFGSVYRTYFGEWWFKRAQYEFGVSAAPKPTALLSLTHRQNETPDSLPSAQAALARYLESQRHAEGMPATVVVAIPVSGNRRRILSEVNALIERELPTTGQAAGQPAFILLNNRTRERTLLNAGKVLRAQIAAPSARLFQVGNGTRLFKQYWTDPARPRSAGQNEKRRLMEIEVSRHLLRAYWLAENAARGRFPSIAPLPDDPNRPRFNYTALNKQLWSYIEWGNKRVAEIKAHRAKAGAAKASRTKTAENIEPSPRQPSPDDPTVS